MTASRNTQCQRWQTLRSNSIFPATWMLWIACQFCFPFQIRGQNRALQFDGPGRHVNLGQVLDMGKEDFTIECWFRADAFPATEDGCLINKGLCAFGAPPGAGYRLMVQHVDGHNEIVFRIAGANGQFAEIGRGLSKLSTGVWYHVAAERKGGALLLFLNGNCITSTDFGEVQDLSTNLPLSLGACRRPPIHPKVSDFFRGAMDEVRFWNVARTRQEIVRNIQQELTGKEPGLLAYFHFNSPSNRGLAWQERYLYDQSSNCLHGQLTGSKGRNKPGWFNWAW